MRPYRLDARLADRPVALMAAEANTVPSGKLASRNPYPCAPAWSGPAAGAGSRTMAPLVSALMASTGPVRARISGCLRT